MGVVDFYYDFFYKYSFITYVLPPVLAFLTYYAFYLPIYSRAS